jgi:hypothetical protein
MKIPRWLTVVGVGGGLTLIVIGLLAFAHTYAHINGNARCFETVRSAQFPKWVGCTMAAHENLAGGLIGFAGAIFAAWLAYSGAQDQLRNTNEQLRATERLRAEERISEAARDIRTLNAARNYLASLARRFPEPNRVNFNDHDFAQTLLHLYQRAHVYISQSASTAPGEFGFRILTVMWRMQTLAENVQAREEKGRMSFQDLKEEIRDSNTGPDRNAF